MIQYNVTTALCYNKSYVGQYVSVNDDCTVIDKTINTIFIKDKIASSQSIMSLDCTHFEKKLKDTKIQVYTPTCFSALALKTTKAEKQPAVINDINAVVEFSSFYNKTLLKSLKENLGEYIDVTRVSLQNKNYIYCKSVITDSNFISPTYEAFVINNTLEEIDTRPLLNVASVNVISNNGKIQINTDIQYFQQVFLLF